LPNTIEVSNITKHYGTREAVKNVSFSAKSGEIVGLLGPNGAGKSTTMNIITGYISATSGSVKVGGFDVLDAPEEAKKRVGYLPENPPVYNEMLIKEYLSFVCDIKGVKPSTRKEMIKKATDAVKITGMEKRLIKNLSKGYRQRVGLAQAMLGSPEAFILDEPTIGLDPKQVIEMRSVIRELGKENAVILSSHILSEVSAVCDRVIIINRGSIVADEPLKTDKKSKTIKMSIRVKGEKEIISSVLSNVPVFERVTPVASREKGSFDFEITGEADSCIREAIFAALSKNDMPILVMRPIDLSLEEIFLRATGGIKQ